MRSIRASIPLVLPFSSFKLILIQENKTNMRPDQRWFPTNRVSRAAWFENFTVQFAAVAPTLGFTQSEVDAVAADNAVVQFAASAINLLGSQMTGARAFERSILLGDNNGAQPHFPEYAVPAPPPMVNAGIFERLERLVRRIRVAAGYNPSVGALLGIIRTTNRIADPQSYVPTLKVTPDAGPYTFNVRCPIKSFNGFIVSYRRNPEASWQTTNTYFRSPAAVSIVPTQPGIAEQLSVRVRMVKGNDPVSEYSQSAVVTVNP